MLFTTGLVVLLGLWELYFLYQIKYCATSKVGCVDTGDGLKALSIFVWYLMGLILSGLAYIVLLIREIVKNPNSKDKLIFFVLNLIAVVAPFVVNLSGVLV